jgi:hypothetical protein
MVKEDNRYYHRHLLEVDAEGQIAGLSLPQIIGIWVTQSGTQYTYMILVPIDKYLYVKATH